MVLVHNITSDIIDSYPVTLMILFSNETGLRSSLNSHAQVFPNRIFEFHFRSKVAIFFVVSPKRQGGGGGEGGGQKPYI